ncbi:hypothetical protein BB560_002850 [Smittium megazygosporum]|uniref:Uncharacterized protein n=1 Tax=Smittium megazygosporum TaxID=133381 RepID=A0A2T9Z8W0_9FUNG|nr:hypothetical protein BB560_004564 [Smittium megazygosporum]PVV02689.1 hypothetical protein BB560_002850 [Smittium megazygosporum]
MKSFKLFKAQPKPSPNVNNVNLQNNSFADKKNIFKKSDSLSQRSSDELSLAAAYEKSTYGNTTRITHQRPSFYDCSGENKAQRQNVPYFTDSSEGSELNLDLMGGAPDNILTSASSFNSDIETDYSSQKSRVVSNASNNYPEEIKIAFLRDTLDEESDYTVDHGRLQDSLSYNKSNINSKYNHYNSPKYLASQDLGIKLQKKKYGRSETPEEESPDFVRKEASSHPSKSTKRFQISSLLISEDDLKKRRSLKPLKAKTSGRGSDNKHNTSRISSGLGREITGGQSGKRSIVELFSRSNSMNEFDGVVPTKSSILKKIDRLMADLEYQMDYYNRYE